MKIKAAVLREMGASFPLHGATPLTITELDLAPPQADEVLVRIAAAGLCHSDLSVINGNRPRPMPMVLGHEAAGVVAALGPDVDDLEVGDHVVMVFMPSCGHCEPCSEGRPALCELGAAANGKGELLRGGSRLSCRGETVNHHLGCSAFADHAVVSRRSLVRIDKDLPLKEAALFGCAVLTGVGAVVNTAAVRPGQSCAVVGLGGIGLAALLGAVASGAYPIVAIDLSDAKLALAKSLGATQTINAGAPDAAEQIRELTEGGVDFAFEMAGSLPALDLAVRVTRRGGTTVTSSLPPPDKNLPLNIVGLVAEERTLKGSYIGSCVPVRDIPRYIALYKAGKLPVDRLMSTTMALDDINHGFELLHEAKVVRQVITF